MVANNFFSGLLADPLFQVGTGLLAADPQASFGQALGQGVQFATGLQAQQARNELIRDELRQRQAAAAAEQRRRAAIAELAQMLNPQQQPAGAPSTGQALAVPQPGDSFAFGPGAGGGGAASPSTAAAPAGQSRRDRILGLLAEVAPDQFAKGVAGQVFAPPPDPLQPTSFQRDFAFLVNQVGLSEAEALDRLRRGSTTNVNVNTSKLDEPIPLTQLPDVRLSDGTTLPIGTTFRQARDAGAVVLSSDEQKTVDQAENALAILNELEALAVGPEGIFSSVQPGFVNRAGAAVDFVFDLIEQDDPRVARFKDLSEGSIATLIRFFGERGALPEGDVQRGLGLLPRLFPLPDTGPVAKDKMRDLRNLIARGLRNLNRGADVRTSNGSQGGAQSGTTQRPSQATGNAPVDYRSYFGVP
ncbi:MAG: hypothetical protein Kow0032_28750 [Methyloligellaceae bacterium]